MYHIFLCHSYHILENDKETQIGQKVAKSRQGYGPKISNVNVRSRLFFSTMFRPRMNSVYVNYASAPRSVTTCR